MGISTPLSVTLQFPVVHSEKCATPSTTTFDLHLQGTVPVSFAIESVVNELKETNAIVVSTKNNFFILNNINC